VGQSPIGLGRAERLGGVRESSRPSVVCHGTILRPVKGCLCRMPGNDFRPVAPTYTGRSRTSHAAGSPRLTTNQGSRDAAPPVR
jgi:hypothetical protein